MKTFDVVIAGGGVIGGSIALELAVAGLQVAIFDQQRPGLEASWASAGILSPAPEHAGMIPTVAAGKMSARLYPEFVARVEELSGQQTGYRPKGTLAATFSQDAREELSTIIALHHGLGLRAEALRPEDARELEPSLCEEIEAAVLRPDEASVDNRALTGAVLEAASRSGVEVVAGRRASRVWREGNRCRGLILEGEKVEAKWTVIAAGCFSALIEGVDRYAPVRPAKGQMASLRCGKVKMERVLWSENIYLVPRNDGRILAGATVEYLGFDKQTNAGGLSKILSGAIELAPELREARIEETWAGLRPDSPDHLPILGPTDVDGLLIATGHFRSGILLAPFTARLIREWITESRVSEDWDRFSPMRFQNPKVSSAGNNSN
jgi:glycine oxidase